MSTLKKAAEIAAGAHRKAHFNIVPRYTSGSPAMVDEWQVCRIADNEREAHERCLTGVYGEKHRQLAETRGLAWIAYARWEKGNKVFRLDLLTGEEIVEPPILRHKDRERLLDLRNRKKFNCITREGEQELEDLEFRAMIHREEV